MIHGQAQLRPACSQAGAPHQRHSFSFPAPALHKVFFLFRPCPQDCCINIVLLGSPQPPFILDLRKFCPGEFTRAYLQLVLSTQSALLSGFRLSQEKQPWHLPCAFDFSIKASLEMPPTRSFAPAMTSPSPCRPCIQKV